jgi:phosphoribosylanthranilate isomerase
MSHPLRVKICGVTTEADALQAGLLGADAVGLNFYPGSPRFVGAAAAGLILRTLPPSVEAVGVFVELPLPQVLEQLRPLARVRTVQWYGRHGEPGDYSPYHFIPAFPVRDAEGLRAITCYLDVCRGLGRLPAAVLVDAHVAGQHGGTGRKVPWELLASFRPGVPLILAGGLTPDNVALAVRLVRPCAVDVASGVEHGPGRKDPEKMRRFLGAAREAAARL